MASAIEAIELRYRSVYSAHGSERAPWQVRRFLPTGQTITLTGLQRGVEYEVQARNIGVNGGLEQ